MKNFRTLDNDASSKIPSNQKQIVSEKQSKHIWYSLSLNTDQVVLWPKAFYIKIAVNTNCLSMLDYLRGRRLKG